MKVNSFKKFPEFNSIKKLFLYEESDYLKTNLLNKEVTADDVAESFYVQLCLDKTTANIITVDGGNV